MRHVKHTERSPTFKRQICAHLHRTQCFQYTVREGRGRRLRSVCVGGREDTESITTGTYSHVHRSTVNGTLMLILMFLNSVKVGDDATVNF
jgi:hypothetical protein